MSILHSFLLSLAGSGQLAGEQPVRIAPVRIVDLEAGRVVPDQALIVKDGRIAAVTAAGDPLPEGVRPLDGQNRCVLPGLIDAHVHLNDPEREARLMVAHGVVFARDMGGSTRERLEQRKRAGEGEFFGVEIVVTGTLVDGSPPYHPWTEAVCRTPAEGRDAVRALVEAGVDQIKVYSRLAPDVYRAILGEAQLLGLRAVGHVPDTVTLLDAARAGQASNEHLTRADTLFSDLVPPGKAAGFAGFASVPEEPLDARLAELAATGMVQCPTLVLNAAYARLPVDADTLLAWRRFAPAEVEGWLEVPVAWRAHVKMERAAWPHKLELVKRMHRAGNPLIVGTDLANPYAVAGFSVHCELEYLVAAGLTPLEALRAATLTPAKFLGLDARLGAIAAGKDASFLLLDANPLEELRTARAPAEVWVRGRRYPREELERFAAEAELMALLTTPADRVLELDLSEAAVR